MPQRVFVVLLLAVCLSADAAPPKKKKAAPAPPQPVAPTAIPHPIAMFLADLSVQGKKSITFKATAVGTRFFLEEPTGVTIYVYDGTSGYKREMFMRGTTLARAIDRYKRIKS